MVDFRSQLSPGLNASAILRTAIELLRGVPGHGPDVRRAISLILDAHGQITGIRETTLALYRAQYERAKAACATAWATVERERAVMEEQAANGEITADISLAVAEYRAALYRLSVASTEAREAYQVLADLPLVQAESESLVFSHPSLAPAGSEYRVLSDPRSVPTGSEHRVLSDPRSVPTGSEHRVLSDQHLVSAGSVYEVLSDRSPVVRKSVASDVW